MSNDPSEVLDSIIYLLDKTNKPWSVRYGVNTDNVIGTLEEILDNFSSLHWKLVESENQNKILTYDIGTYRQQLDALENREW